MRQQPTSIRMLTIAALAVFLGGTASVVLPPSAAADEIVSSIVRGAKLYDKWYAVTGAEKPADTHKSWPASNTKKKGDTTWRCKSCHGWDLMGKDGAYATGSYKTGISGVQAFKGKDNAEIIAVLKDDKHGFGGLLGDQDMTDLANFVSQGQVDMDAYIDRASKAPKGDKAKGEVYFNTVCAGCHAKDGRMPKDMPPLGSLMGNPWEVLHKILNGQPAEAMPALRALDRQIAADIMAHLTTLPKR